ncbi:MAG: outer membrane protein assembly factor BamD [Gammaproteobacteria bacterium]|nr:outer membrane protein assembly factor BamD [Gammaproteobacteria bacterium]
MKIYNKINKICLLVLASSALFLTNCSSADRDEYANSSADEIYKEAVTHLNKGRFEPAIKSYEALETHFPFGETTTNGQLELIYAYYKNQDYVQAITAAERYLRLHPLSPNADYVYYMKGLSYFEQGINMLTNIVNTNPALRDVTHYQTAFQHFQTVVRQYPKSKYAHDAKRHMIFARNIIAEHEVAIANYYIERKAYVAAANRARYVLEHLPNTPAEKKALDILENAYAQLKLTPLLKSNGLNNKPNIPNIIAKK